MQDQRTGLITPSRERIREAAKALFAERGYESTSTIAICRLAGTSESQLIKHFETKQGVLEAVFQHAWEQVNPAIRLATESIASPRLLEGRRIRDDGKQVVLVPGLLEFVKIVDGILQELNDQGELAVHPQALRSALMGAMEGLLRDKILARSIGYPATFSDADVRSLCFTFLNASLSGKGVDPAIRC